MLFVPFPLACYLVPRRNLASVHVSSVASNPRTSLTPHGHSTLEWVCFIVLDLGLDVIESLPPGTRAVAGLFQSFAVRASGFPIVSLSALAPSFQCVEHLMYAFTSG